jgi:hypothetical protein
VCLSGRQCQKWVAITGSGRSHSITSSAKVSRDDGAARPRDFAAGWELDRRENNDPQRAFIS